VDPEREDEMIQAARRGRHATVERLLTSGVRADSVCRNTGRTALLCAASSGEAKCVAALLKGGANVNSKTSSNDTALHLAVSSAPFGKDCPKQVLACITHLLHAGANINAVNNMGKKPVDLTIEQDVKVRELLNPSSTDAGDHTDSDKPTSAVPFQPIESEMTGIESSKPPKKLIPLMLPHPTVTDDVCKALWGRSKEAPDSTARRTLAILDEVLGDLCMDNLEPSEFEKLEETAGKPTYLYYLRALHREGITMPPALFAELQHYATLAAAVAKFPEAMRISESGAHSLIMLLSETLVWCTAGALTPQISGMGLSMRDNGALKNSTGKDHASGFYIHDSLDILNV